MSKEPNTEELDIPDTEELGDTEEVNTDEPALDSDDTQQDEDFLAEVAELAKSFSEPEPPEEKPMSRKERVVLEVAEEMDNTIDERGEPDYVELSKIYKAGTIGDAALAEFASSNGLELATVKANLRKPKARETDLESRLRKLEERDEQAKLTQTQTDFVDNFQQQCARYGLSVSQFKAEFGDTYADLIRGKLSALPLLDAQELAFELTAGKKYAASQAAKTADTRARKREGAKSPPTSSAQPAPKDRTKTRKEFMSWDLSTPNSRKAYETYCKEQKEKGLPLYT